MNNPLFQTQSPLPPRPNYLNAEDRARTNPNVKLAPQQKRAALALLASTLEQQLANYPGLQPITVKVDTRPDGWSLHVDIPPMNGTDEVALPDGIQP